MSRKLTEIIETDTYIKQYKTDKEELHQYCSLIYQNLFKAIQSKKMDILEIGIKNGSSLVLWNEFFTNAIVYGIDNANLIGHRLDAYPRIKPIIQDAYNPKVLNHLPLFDIIIDDGPHTLESQIQFIRMYFHKLKQGGILIIEDIAKEDYAKQLISEAQKFSSALNFIDTRKQTHRYDNMILIIRNDQNAEYLK